MSLLRHGEIYPYEEGTIHRTVPQLILWMSLQLAIPGGCALQQGPLPLHQPASCCNNNQRRSTQKQRTANLWLTGCLTQWVQCT